MNNSMVAHNWVHGKTGSGSNLRTDGTRLISYNTIIAVKIDDIIYISSYNFSQSTSKHLISAWGAASHLRDNIFYAPGFEYGYAWRDYSHVHFVNAAIEECKKRLDTVLTGNHRANTKNDAICAYMARRNTILTHAARVRVKIDMRTFPAYDTGGNTVADYIAKKQAAAAAAEKKRVAAAKKQQIADKKQFTQWIETGSGSCPHSYTVSRYATGDYITVKGETVITSQGAECPLKHAIIACKFWQSRQQVDGSFEPYQTNGHTIHLGNFKLNRIDIKGNVYAGCHAFTAATIAAFIERWVK